MQLFLCKHFFKKKSLIFFDSENMKKPPTKVANNQPATFFVCTGPAAQMTQKQKSRTTKSPLMQDCVFRLGVTYCYKSFFSFRLWIPLLVSCWIGRVYKYKLSGYSQQYCFKLHIIRLMTSLEYNPIKWG